MQSFIDRLKPLYAYPQQLVFIDETSKDVRDLLRRRGWSRKGSQVCTELPFSRGKRLSVLAAFSTEGFIAHSCTEGTFDRARFHTAMKEKIIPLLNPYPLPRSIVIIDNAKIHCYDELAELIESVGAILIYLPPYCPHLNPIEYYFGILKKWIQRHASHVWNVDPESVLEIALAYCTRQNSLSPHSSINTFWHCGYRDSSISIEEDSSNREDFSDIFD